MKYYFFLDETGDHGLSYVDKNFPLFLLCGCLFSEAALEKTQAKMNALKQEIFKSGHVILHSREIRKCEGAFQVLFNLALKEKFYKGINQIMSEAEFKIIAAGINKEEHTKHYGKGAIDPYELCLSFLLERLVFCMDSLDKSAVADIHVEQRGAKENASLVAHYNSTRDRGTYFVSSERLKARTRDFRFFSKRQNIAGLQIADLCAYPLARYILNPKEPYVPFSVIKGKIYSKKGDFNGWGLKVFP